MSVGLCHVARNHGNLGWLEGDAGGGLVRAWIPVRLLQPLAQIQERQVSEKNAQSKPFSFLDRVVDPCQERGQAGQAHQAPLGESSRLCWLLQHGNMVFKCLMDLCVSCLMPGWHSNNIESAFNALKRWARRRNGGYLPKSATMHLYLSGFMFRKNLTRNADLADRCVAALSCVVNYEPIVEL